MLPGSADSRTGHSMDHVTSTPTSLSAFPMFWGVNNLSPPAAPAATPTRTPVSSVKADPAPTPAARAADLPVARTDLVGETLRLSNSKCNLSSESPEGHLLLSSQVWSLGPPFPLPPPGFVEPVYRRDVSKLLISRLASQILVQ
jgi:hypothetical protein